jgi:hypothetical protein
MEYSGGIADGGRGDDQASERWSRRWWRLPISNGRRRTGRAVVPAAETNRVSDDLVKCGCALGGSAILLAASRTTPRTLYVLRSRKLLPSLLSSA